MVFHQLIEELTKWVPLWLSEASWDCIGRSNHFYSYRVVVHSFHTFPRGHTSVPQYLLVFPYLIYVSIRINDIVARYRSHSQLVYVSFDCTILCACMMHYYELTGILSRCNILSWESLFEHTFIVKVFQLYWLYTINKYHSFIPLTRHQRSSSLSGALENDWSVFQKWTALFLWFIQTNVRMDKFVYFENIQTD